MKDEGDKTMTKRFPTTIKANGQEYICTVWNKVQGRERVYIKTASGKDCLYYDVASDSFVNQRTWGNARQQPNVEAAFRAAIVEVEEVEKVKATEIKESKTETVRDCYIGQAYFEQEREDFDNQ
jgi:hypothetical protein